jgi:hypothetical protein
LLKDAGAVVLSPARAKRNFDFPEAGTGGQIPLAKWNPATGYAICQTEYHARSDEGVTNGVSVENIGFGVLFCRFGEHMCKSLPPRS